MDRDRSEGSMKNIKGRMKEGLGKALGDFEDGIEGKMDKAEVRSRNRRRHQGFTPQGHLILRKSTRRPVQPGLFHAGRAALRSGSDGGVLLPLISRMSPVSRIRLEHRFRQGISADNPQQVAGLQGTEKTLRVRKTGKGHFSRTDQAPSFNPLLLARILQPQILGRN
ncbi:CsbD family protein [Microvirga arabica]|uniref:CsbD family protein n=1 Tax=Microvirga arabica TaxID=1128671 RepID=UPI0036231780